MTMNRTAAQQAALDAFVQGATSDEDYGYPHGAVFVAVGDDTETAGNLLWTSLHEGRPVILVKENEEQMLIAPVRLNAYRRVTDRIRGRIPVAVGSRPHPIAEPSSPPMGTALRAEIRRDSLVTGDFAFACA
jgi:hypothetical protein